MAKKAIHKTMIMLAWYMIILDELSEYKDFLNAWLLKLHNNLS